MEIKKNSFLSQSAPLLKDKLMKGTFALFIGGMVANVCNYLFQFIMSRGLSVSDFGAMNSLLSLMVIVSVPSTSVLLISAKYVSELKANANQIKIKIFQQKLLKKLIFCCTVILLPALIIIPWIADFLKIDSYYPVALLFFVLFLTFIIPVNLGTLQGMQKFFPVCNLWVIGAVTKIIFGFIAISIGFQLNGAIGAILAGCIATFTLSFYFLKDLPWNYSESNDIGLDYKQVWISSMPIIACSLCISGLTNIDILLVKHFFSVDEAGIYASISVLGRTIYYVPSAIIMAMFPLVSETHTLKTDPFHLLKKAIGTTIILAGSVLIVLVAFPEFMLSMLFGPNYIVGAAPLRLFSIAMFFLTLVFVYATFLLAIEKRNFLYVLLIGLITEIVLITYFHHSITHVLIVVLSVSSSMCFILTIMILMLKQKKTMVSEP
ncbi:MAG: oligosaccharide flippase family protein [Pseudomonadota bacterium]